MPRDGLAATSASTTSTSSRIRRSRLILDDARHFLLTTNEKFDAITSDPLDPWVKGAATLYTREFFEMVKQHLNPGGVVTLFVQLYESNPAAVKSEIATFLEAFPNGVVWGNTQQRRRLRPGADGDSSSRSRSTSTRSSRRSRARSTRGSRSRCREIGMNSATDLFSTYAGKRPDLDPWLADAMINRDRNLRLQYLAGLGLNLYQSEADLRRHAEVRHALSRRALHGLAGDHPGAQSRDREAAGKIEGSKCRVQDARANVHASAAYPGASCC